MKIIGVDPGMSGAITYLDNEELLVWDMPIHPKEAGGNDLDIHKLYSIIKEMNPVLNVAYYEAKDK